VQVAVYGPAPVSDCAEHPVIGVAPSAKPTVPPPSPALTLAVNVTDWPKTGGLAGDALTVVFVGFVICWVTGDEVLAW
jgi:hypothetical protein